MTFRPHPKYASSDARNGPWSACDSCGFNWSQSSLQWQYDYRGGSTPVNTHLLKCPRCLDQANPQFRLLILPPDPRPLQNLRPEAYTVDEISWLVTESDDTITTESGNPIITDEPNPDDDANITYLAASLSYGAALTVAYLDLFDGDPTTSGVSILSTVTGSATRANVFASLALDGSQYVNTATLTVTAAAEANANLSHVALYSAATGGTLLTSGPATATAPTIVDGAGVAFAALDLVIQVP